MHPLQLSAILTSLKHQLSELNDNTHTYPLLHAAHALIQELCKLPNKTRNLSLKQLEQRAKIPTHG